MTWQPLPADDGWWQPQHEGDQPDWPPIDLGASHLSAAVLVRDDGRMRQILRKGPMTVALLEPSTRRVFVEVSVPEGVCTFVAVSTGREVAIRQRADAARQPLSRGGYRGSADAADVPPPARLRSGSIRREDDDA